MKAVRVVLVAGVVLAGWVGSAQAAVTVTSTNFYYSGNVGNGLTTVPATPPDVALASNGGVQFADSCLSGYAAHSIPHLNDGKYGNSFSWIAASSRTIALGGSYGSVNLCGVGVMLTDGSGVVAHSITGFSFGRSNLGEYGDRIGGNMYIQYTTSESLDGTTNATSGADANWTTLGYISMTDVYDHVFSISNTISPLVMTGIRIVTANGNCIDEIALYGTPGGFDNHRK